MFINNYHYPGVIPPTSGGIHNSIVYAIEWKTIRSFSFFSNQCLKVPGGVQLY